MSTNRMVSRDVAVDLLAQAGQEYAVVENPSYVHPRYDIYPLPARVDTLEEGMAGAVMDMDGTTTTTEPLCLHSLETMVRRITGRESDPGWKGLNAQRDYPHIIGNSTTKHVEYLIRAYKPEISLEHMRFFFIHAAAWTLGKGADEGRKLEVRNNCAALGIGDVLRDEEFCTILKAGSLDEPGERAVLERLADRYGPRLGLATETDQVRAAVDIYYQRYHHILGQIKAGLGDQAAQGVFGDGAKRLIEPMKGIGVFLALIKGRLGEHAEFCFDAFAEHLLRHGAVESRKHAETYRRFLRPLGLYFERRPVSVAVVTSSIFYEADIVLGEVFRVLGKQVESWDVPIQRRRVIAGDFEEYSAYYDGFVTASDSSEIRLKPHRDLYSIALHRMGLHPEDFHKVVGFEDSESGVIAIRAAGIPMCCALPFPETRGHNFEAATYVARAGLPEVVLKKRVFLPDRLLLEGGADRPG